MAREKLDAIYVYKGGAWEEIPFTADEPWTFELFTGAHDEEEVLCGYIGEEFERLSVSNKLGQKRYNRNSKERDEHGPTIYSAASRWGFDHAALYGNPQRWSDPHIAVLEIADDGYEGIYDHLTPYPYLVVAQITSYTTSLVFAEDFPSLVGLLGELLPLIGVTEPPTRPQLLDLHMWSANHSYTAP